MNYHTITDCDMLNGEGVRVVLWVSGCEHACSGCQNPQTWSACSGLKFDKEAEKELFDKLSNPYITGFTGSGGDPLATYNRKEFTRLLKKIKKNFPNKDIWVYTGYTYEDIINIEAMQYIDFLVDGKYDEHSRARNSSVKWRGDETQRIIDIKKTNLDKTSVIEATKFY